MSNFSEKPNEHELDRLLNYFRESIEFTRLAICARRKSNNDTTQQEYKLEMDKSTYKILKNLKNNQ